MLSWIAYRAKHGPLTNVIRIERQLASLQAIVVQALGGEATPDEFVYSSYTVPQKEGISMKQAIDAFKQAGAL